MRVEIWTDIICPWCGIGHHRLKAALARFGHAEDVELVHRSFQLDERAPLGETMTARQMLRTRKGLSDAQIDAVADRVEALAAADGLRPYIVRENLVGNTSLAHELAAWATELGHEGEVWDALYRAYFGEARSIFEVSALAGLAGELGLDPAQAREALIARTYAPKVLADGREARALGASGVPFVVVDRRYAVPGAQSVDELARVLEKAWQDRPAPLEPAASEAELCGPDGCAVPPRA
jgi:predicted DsbA family dithiol-disulfide isomerase